MRRFISKTAIETIKELYCAEAPQPTTTVHLKETDIRWVINDNGKLGVRIGDTLFWFYRGETLRQDYHEEEAPMAPRFYRQIGKLEFGEGLRPQGWTPADNRLHNWERVPERPKVAASAAPRTLPGYDEILEAVF